MGTCALRKLRTLLIMRCLSSSGSRHGKTVMSEFGARATSIEDCSGCDGVSSGKHQDRRPAVLDEFARHAVEEVGLHVVLIEDKASGAQNPVQDWNK